ncbi:MAG: AMP-binding protein [Melioribacteraceae bacterium]|nr:AMP-binding protein [Melioribacteraceae bacterium]MCO6472752.1 AMP-binding protein [Melioribacteraceae bacterium]
MKTTQDLYSVPRITSLQDMLLRSAEEYGSKLAMEDLNKTPIQKQTYSQLLDSVLRLGTALKSLGIEERSHIAIIGENRVQWAVSYLTCACFNFIVVPIDKNLNANEILNILHESDSEVIISSASYLEIFDDVSSALPRLKYFISMDPTSNEQFHSMIELMNNAEPLSKEALPNIKPNELFEIIFTSGSLGRAKGVMLSQANITSNLMSMVSMLFMHPEDRFLSVLPMHHTYECTCGMLCPLYCGSSIHYSRSLKTVVDDIQQVKATVLLGVPLLYDKMFRRISKSIKDDKVKSKIVPPLVKLTNIAQKIGLKEIKKSIFKELHHKFGGHIRVFIAGGAAPDPEVAKGLREFGFNFLQGYGLTETSPILALNRLNNFKDNAAGIPLPGVEIKILDPDENGSGEIAAKGPNIMLGYYKNDDQTKKVLADGWFKTGDIGFFDEDGFLHINGRKKNVIVSRSGKNVFPEEIEDVLNRSQFVLESIVFGEKDDKQGEIISAIIVVDTESFLEFAETEKIKLSEKIIDEKIKSEIDKVNKQLALHQQIKKFTIRDREFEKTTTQKIKRYLVDQEE